MKMHKGESGSSEDRPVRKNYKSPQFVEYGSIAKLTQTNSKTGGADDGGAAMMVVTCL